MQRYALTDPNQLRHHGNVTQLDHAFGLLMRALAAEGMTESTFVFFTSDNGPDGEGHRGRGRGSTAGLRGRKRSLYEGGIRVPALARWPRRIPAGSVSHTPIIGTDLFSTALALANIAAPTDRRLDGVDLGDVLLGGATDVVRREPLYWRLGMATPFQLALRAGTYKLLATEALDRVELYDLSRDPYEQSDLSSAEPERAAALIAKLTEVNASVEADGPDWWRRLSPNGAMPASREEVESAPERQRR
jgi:arylsulfatase A